MKTLRFHPPAKNRLLLCLLLLTAVLYFHSVGHDFIWDDEFFIQKNRFLLSWADLPRLLTNSMTLGASGVQSNFYRPLQALTHFFDVQAFGLAPAWHHFTNILLEVSMGCVFFLMLGRLFPSREGERGHYLALFFALSLWLFHPLQSEAAGYLSGRGDLLVAFFMGLAVLAWPRHRWWTLFFCACAMLSKENGIVVPVFVILCDWMNGQEQRSARASATLYLPLLLLSAVYGIARLTFLNFQNTLNFFGRPNILTEHYSYRVFTYFSTLTKGLQLIFFPVGLHHGRSWFVFTGLHGIFVLAGIFFAIAMIAGILIFRRRSPPLAAGLAWFLIAGLPTSNLFGLINALLYDHWFLLPSFGFVFIFVLFFRWGLQKWPLGAMAALWLAMILPLFLLTWRQNATWQTAEAQYKSILRYEPNSWPILNNLAIQYAEAGRLEEAKPLYLRSLKVNETAQAHNNLGRIYLTQNQVGAALRELQRAVEVDPTIYQARTGLGLAYLASGRCAEAAASFQAALKIYPDPAAAQGLQRAHLCPP